MFVAAVTEAPRPLVIPALRSDVIYQTAPFNTVPSGRHPERHLKSPA